MGSEMKKSAPGRTASATSVKGTPLSSPTEPRRQVVPILDALIAYERKGVGVDMALKSVLGVFRLCMLYSSDPADKKKFAKVVDSIIECRMLCNFGRPAMTLRQGLKTLAMRDKLEFWHWIFLLLSFFLRVPEQISGDLNYMQKTVFHNWSRQRLSFYYRFFKSLSLTCCVLSELTRRKALHANIEDAPSPGAREKAELELTVSNVLITRTLCDMYVYYKWVPSYTPNRTLEYICGSVSGVLGMWLVWKDTRYVIPCTCPCAPQVDTPLPCGTSSKLSRLESVSLHDGEGGGSGDDG